MAEVSTSVECPDGQHRWVVVRDYHGRDYFAVTTLDERPDGVRVTADMFSDSDEFVEVHSEPFPVAGGWQVRRDTPTVAR